jgi:hypothetical protein
VHKAQYIGDAFFAKPDFIVITWNLGLLIHHQNASVGGQSQIVFGLAKRAWNEELRVACYVASRLVVKQPALCQIQSVVGSLAPTEVGRSARHHEHGRGALVTRSTNVGVFLFANLLLDLGELLLQSFGLFLE